MLCAIPAARTHFPSAIFRRRFPYRSSVSMSSSDSPPSQIVEHIVLFKVKPSAEPSAVASMLTNLNSLTSLDSVLHLSAGPISRCRSKALTFTHMLHSRYQSKPDLATYTDHPSHVSVVANYVRPVVEDVMAVDWVADDFSGPVEIPPSSAARFTVLKLKDESGKDDVLKAVRGVGDKIHSIEQLTAGENFSPGRAKGYSIASVAVFNGFEELEGLGSELEVAKLEKDREFIEDVLMLDLVVAAAAVQPSSL